MVSCLYIIIIIIIRKRGYDVISTPTFAANGPDKYCQNSSSFATSSNVFNTLASSIRNSSSTTCSCTALEKYIASPSTLKKTANE